MRISVNHYSFGSAMPGRSYSSPTYRYGFNGKEKDNETSVDGGNYDFGARIYDSRLGKWLSLDPLSNKYPEVSPYNGYGNNPISIIDVDGRDIILYFYSQAQSESGAGHVAIAVGSDDNNLTYFSHYPTHKDAPGGAHIQTGLTFDKAYNYDVNAGLQGSPPTVAIRIKTDKDVDAAVIEKLTEMLSKEWGTWGPNCADGGCTAVKTAGLLKADWVSAVNAGIAAPNSLMAALQDQNKEKWEDGTISVEKGDLQKYNAESKNPVILETVTVFAEKKTQEGAGFFKKIGDSFKEFYNNVKSTLEQGIQSIQDWKVPVTY